VGLCFVIFPVEGAPCLVAMGIGTQGLFQMRRSWAALVTRVKCRQSARGSIIDMAEEYKSPGLSRTRHGRSWTVCPELPEGPHCAPSHPISCGLEKSHPAGRAFDITSSATILACEQDSLPSSSLWAADARA
jgi:hypothetical protein